MSSPSLTTPASCPNPITAAARGYAAKGWAPIPVPYRQKNPGIQGWQNLRITEPQIDQYFNGKPQNVGINLGAASGGLVDIDLDCMEAVRLAPHILPHTSCKFGRPGKPISHWEYIAEPIPATTKFPDTRKVIVEGKSKTVMLVEVRSTNAQSIYPPSTHKETGEPIRFIENVGEPQSIDTPILLALVSKLAALSLLARHWPGEGSRHEAALALCGGLARAGWAVEDIAEAVTHVASAAGDEETADRAMCARTSVERIASGGKATGWTTLVKLMDRATVDRVREWLGVSGAYEERDEDQPSPAANGSALILDPKDPLPTAERFHRAFYDHPDGTTLLCDGETFELWTGTRYEDYREAAIRAKLYPYLASSRKYITRGENRQLSPFQPTQANVNNVIDALKALIYCGRVAPCWLDDDPLLPDPSRIIPSPNGLVHLRSDATAELFRPPTPLFFSRNAIDFSYDSAAPEPTHWLGLMDQLWPDDRQAIELLQEWFGYTLTIDTRQQKALLLVGPKRAGKGTIARVLRRLIGASNVCGPTLSGLSGQFGLWSLIGKQLAIIDDARLSNRADQAIVVERILTITGEGSIDVDRKNLQPVTLRLLARLMLLTNELPRLSDASGALASRFLILTLTESFYGREDTGLEDRICTELPGILLWAIEGWKRLQRRGHFVQPATSSDAIEELNDLASPISSFLRDWCIIRPGAEVKVAELFDGWRSWCREQGRDQAGTQCVFGRDLRAAVPGIVVGQHRKDGSIHRVYKGITLTESGKLAAHRDRAQRGATRDFD